MVTIIDAGPSVGHSRWDHLLTGREAESVIGKSYRSVAEARAAVSRAVAANGDPRAVGSRAENVWLDVRHADGSIHHK